MKARFSKLAAGLATILLLVSFAPANATASDTAYTQGEELFAVAATPAGSYYFGDKSTIADYKANRSAGQAYFVPMGRNWDGTYTATTWAACGAYDKNEKLVREFVSARPGYSKSKAYLRCGKLSWGYRHIQDRHMDDWAALGLMVGAKWRDMADFGMWAALGYPERVYPTTDRVTYYTTIRLYNSRGELRAPYQSRAARAEGTGRVLTAFYSR